MAFSENFDVIKGYATNAAQAAAKKTKMLATIAKANISILAEEDKIKKAQTELGKVYYKDFVLDEEPDQAEYLPLCEKITESLKLIDDLKAQIEAAKIAGNAPAESEEEPEEEPAKEVVAEVVEEVAPELPEIVVVEEVPAEEAPEAPAEEPEAPAEDAPAEDAPAEEEPEA